MQTCLDEWMSGQRVLFATRNKGEAREIGEHGPGAILSVEPKQGTRLWDLVCCEVARDRREALAEFRSVASVAAVAKTAEPLIAMSLRNNRACTDDLPTLAPGVASSTHVIQPPKGRGQVFSLWQRTLTGRFTRAIKITDQPLAARSIHHAPGCLLGRERPT